MSNFLHAAHMRVAVAASILMLMCAQVTAQEWSWTSDKVARGVTSSIALDVDRNLHLAYLTKDAKAFYAFRPGGSSKWFPTMVVDSTHTNMRVFPRIAVDKQDRPHMCVSFGVLVYITFTNHQWVKQQVDPGSGTISYYCSIAVSPDGVPHVGWYHEFLPDGSHYGHFRGADLEDGVWIARSIDGGISGKWSSMVIDPKGFAHASYSQFARGSELDYAVWDGNNWVITTVDSSQNIGSYRSYDNSLALWPDGSAHITYFDGRTLKYAQQAHGKWIIEKVDIASAGHDYYGGNTTLLRDSHDNPHIIYGDFGAVKHAYWDGKKWQIENVASGAMQQYKYVDGAIGPGDTLYVSYPDPDDGFVKVATGKLASNTQTTKK